MSPSVVLKMIRRVSSVYDLLCSVTSGSHILYCLLSNLNINATSLKYGRVQQIIHEGLLLIILSPLQMETVTKILIKMHPLSISGAMVLLYYYVK